MKVCLIGAGITGLTVAYRLAKRGNQVIVFEREGHPGGIAAPLAISGSFVEKAYHLTYVTDTQTFELINELGLQDKLHWNEVKLGIYHQKKIYYFSGLPDLLKFKPLSLVSKVRTALTLFYLSKIRNWKRLDSIPFHQWAKRLAGRQAYEVLWEPLLEKKFGPLKEQTPTAWLWGKTARRTNSRSNFRAERFAFVEGSFKTIYDKLTEEIVRHGGVIHFGTHIQHIHLSGNRIEKIQFPGGVEYVDKVVSTIPFQAFLQLIPDQYSHIIKHNLPHLHALQYKGAICLIMSMRKSLTDICWLNVNDLDLPFIVVIEISNLIGTAAFGGNSVFYVASYLSPDSQDFVASPAEIFSKYSKGLQRIFPAYDPSLVTEYHVIKHRYADPVPRLNYADLMPPLSTPIENLYLSDFTRVYPYDKGSYRAIEIANQISQLLLSG